MIQYLKMVGRAAGHPPKWDKAGKFWRVDPEIASDVAHMDSLSHTRAFTELVTRSKAAAGDGESLTLLVKDAEIPSQTVDGRTMYDHQTQGVRFLLETGKCILADDMGLGKTIQSLVAATIVSANAGLMTVIITKANLVRDWKEEAWKVGLRRFSVHSWASIPEPSDGRYILIADEAHFAQNPTSIRTKSMLALAKRAACVWLLTGTPMANGLPKNIYPLLRAIEHPIAKNRAEYERRYCKAKMTEIRIRGGAKKKVWKTDGMDNLDELSNAVAPILLRRLKSECLDLPPKTRIYREVEPTQKMLAEWNDVRETATREYRSRVASKEVSKESAALVAMGILRQAATMAKIDETISVADEVMSEGRKVVIFTGFKKSAFELAKRMGVKPCTGETTNENHWRIKEFQAGKANALVGTGDAIGTGTTLTAADTVIMHDRPMRPGDCEQWEDRLQRIGQTSNVTSFWIRAFGIDQAIDNLLIEKLKVISKVVDGREFDENNQPGVITAREVIGKLNL